MQVGGSCRAVSRFVRHRQLCISSHPRLSLVGLICIDYVSPYGIQHSTRQCIVAVYIHRIVEGYDEEHMRSTRRDGVDKSQRGRCEACAGVNSPIASNTISNANKPLVIKAVGRGQG
jgi:hypothetical protein